MLRLNLAKALVVLTLASAVACTPVATELHTAQLLYKDARYEEAQIWLGELQVEASSMPPAELARYYYLRGMTAYRLGQREDALHYLALTDQLNAEDPSRLPEGWRPVMERTLQEVTPTTASPHARNPLRPDTI
jgi:tetratricopeptide (TPR) repeat protein